MAIVRRLPALVICLLLLARGLAAAGAVGVGDRFPWQSLTGWDGAPIAPGDVAGKPVVVDFWASWCLPCRTALPAIDAIARKLRDRGVVVIAVNVDRNRSAADAWLAERLPERTLTLAHDPEGGFLARCGAAGMPAVYVVDRDGVVRFAEAGYALDRIAAIERAAEAVAAPAASK
jgi:thiol-disulfide isomerase/thioredoxin